MTPPRLLHGLGQWDPGGLERRRQVGFCDAYMTRLLGRLLKCEKVEFVLMGNVDVLMEVEYLCDAK